MKPFKEKKLKRILLMTLTTAVCSFNSSSTTFAEDVKPEATSENRVTVTDSNYNINGSSSEFDGTYSFVYGGGDEENTAAVSKNTVNVLGGNWYGIFGGVSSTGDVTGNLITIHSGNIVEGVSGGFTFFSYDDATSAGNVIGNKVVVNGGNIGYVAGGEVGYSYPSNGSVSDDFSESYFQTGGNVSENSVEVNGGIITGGIVGGSALTGSSTNNTISLSGGTVTGSIVAGEVRNPLSESTVTGNSITITGIPDLTSAYLVGGILGDEYSPTGNTLNINTKNITALNIYGFGDINFVLPSMSSGDYIFRLTDGSTDFSNVNMTVSVSGDSNVKSGDNITLITNSNGIDISGLTLNGTAVGTSRSYSERGYQERSDVEIPNGTFSKGITQDFDFTLNSVTDSNGLVTSLSADVGQSTVNRQIDALPGPNSAAVLMNIEHLPELPDTPIDNVIELDAISSGVGDIKIEDSASSSDGAGEETQNSTAEDIIEMKQQHGYEIYANLGGGHMKFKTGNGSYIKTDSGNYDIGVARKFQTGSGMFIFAPMVEYGHSKYTSYSPTELVDINGSGHSKYTAGGAIFRSINNSGFYYEGSFRGGRTDTRFASSDFLQSGLPTYVTYHTEAPIYMGHVRVGHILRMDKNNLLDIYGIYSYARQNSSSTTLSTGEHYKFSSVDSSKLKIGYRSTSQVSRISQLYYGLAYQYDSSTDSVATTGAISTKSSGASGSSGMLEIGWLIKPLRDNPWAVDINTTGWLGHQEGVKAMAKIKKAF